MKKSLVKAFFVSLLAFFAYSPNTVFAIEEVNVSSMEDQTLNDEQIKSVLSDRIIRGVNSRGQKVEFFFRSGGYLIGNTADGKNDSGRWTVSDGKLCMTWSRWTDSCGLGIVEKGKLRLGPFKQD